MDPHEPRIPRDLDPDEGRVPPRWLHDPLCAHCRTCTRELVIRAPDLEEFTAGILARHGVAAEDARIVARVLVASDVRGIPSHGVARLGRYVHGIQQGWIRPGAAMDVVEPVPSVAVVDAGNGLGQVAAERAMDLAIAKARDHGVGVVTVRRSNHYGIAGYYALKAVDAGMIGVSTTNAAPLVVPTHGAEMVLGTNPIAFGAPAGRNRPFLLDMATSVVPRGKLEVYDRNRKPMPEGWATDEQGYDTRNAGHVLRNLLERRGGGILPLGGRGELFSGYKGYGLAFMVDILSGVLSGAAFGVGVDDVHRPVAAGETAYPDVGHFFLALDVARFMPLEAFQARLDQLIEGIKGSRKALDQETIWIHGEKEFLEADCHLAHGVPLARNVYESLASLARACDHPLPRVLET